MDSLIINNHNDHFKFNFIFILKRFDYQTYNLKLKLPTINKHFKTIQFIKSIH